MELEVAFFFLEADMESMVGMEPMGKESARNRMSLSYEQDILTAARVHNRVRRSKEGRPAWYGPVLAWLGSLLVAFGTRLQSYYSIRQANSVR